MAYNIVKHRRGTTEEWKASSLIPHAGELVIEECEDGEIRCKVGDGVRSWDALNYVDTRTNKELSKAISVINTKIAQLEQDYASDRQALTNKIEADIAEAVAAITKAYADADISTLEQATNELNTKICEVSRQLSDSADALYTELGDVNKSTSENIEVVRTDLEQRMDDQDEQIKVVISQVSGLNSKLDDEVSTITAELADLKNINSSLSEAAGVVSEKVENVKTDTETKLKDFESDIDEIATSTSQAVTELNSKFDSLQESTNFAVHDLETRITEAKSDYEDKILAARDESEAAIDLLRDESEVARNVLKNESEAARNVLKNEYTKAIKLIEDHVRELNATLDSSAANTNKDIEELRKSFTGIFEDLAAKTNAELTKLTNELSTANNNLSDLSENVSEQHLYMLNRLWSNTNTLKDIKTELLNKINDIEQQAISDQINLQTHIEHQQIINNAITDTIELVAQDFYEELIYLVDADIFILERAYSLYNQAYDRMAEIIEQVDTNTYLVNGFDDKITSVNTNIADIDAKFTTDISNIRVAITNTNTSLNGAKQTHADDIKKINDKLETIETDNQDTNKVVKDRLDNIDTQLDEQAIILNKSVFIDDYSNTLMVRTDTVNDYETKTIIFSCGSSRM